MFNNTMWLIFTQNFGMRTVTPHVKLLWGDVELQTDSEGDEFLEHTEKATKTRTGAVTQDVRPFLVKAFACPGRYF